MPHDVTTRTTQVSLDDAYDLVEAIGATGLDVHKLIDALQSGDPAARVLALLQPESVYPLQWSKPTLHEYARNDGGFSWANRMEIEADGLTYSVCADCGDHVWVRVGGQESHLSRRMKDFAQITATLQVKATGKGLLVRRPQTLRGNVKFCRYACD